MTVEEFMQWLEAVAEDPPDGCSDDDIQALLLAQGASRLPPAYDAFMRRCGRSCDPFLRGTVVEYPLVAEAKGFMEEALRDDGNRFVLTPEAVVFTSHQGYQYWYFPDGGRDEVWDWLEGREPRPFFARFEDWLDAQVAFHEFCTERSAVWDRGEPVEWSRQFDFDRHRTLS
jgi:hypothetical protein